jgi:hypothetical protein
MKYALMFIRNDDEWFNSSDYQEKYGEIGSWFIELAQGGRIANPGVELQPARNATTVRWNDEKPIVTDGPFMESKEGIGGITIIEAADLDEAIAVAKGWPAHDHAVEIRPIVEHGEIGG